MIKGIAAGTMIDIQGVNSGSYILGTANGQGVGNMRYCTNKQQIEVWDGNIWQQLYMPFPTVNLSGSAVSAITWAMDKMAEDANLEKLSKDHPAIKFAYENLRRAQEQLKATITYLIISSKVIFLQHQMNLISLIKNKDTKHLVNNHLAKLVLG
jgi:hypothetical protein